MFSSVPGPIGIFDSGYGGLTIFDKIRAAMPGYDYIYLGDNARSPYGTRSFEVVYRFTKQAVETLFNEGCQLVILACNTASAKALRTIQQRNLPQWDPARRVLGVIRPTVELMDKISETKENIYGLPQTAKDKLAETTGAAKDKLAETTGAAKDKLAETTGAAKDKLAEKAENYAASREEKKRERELALEEKKRERAELMERYEKLYEEKSFGFQRLMKAFPDMKSRDNNETLEKFKIHFNIKKKDENKKDQAS